MAADKDSVEKMKEKAESNLIETLESMGYIRAKPSGKYWKEKLGNLKEKQFSVVRGKVAGRFPQFADYMIYWTIGVRPEGKPSSIGCRLNMFYVDGELSLDANNCLSSRKFKSSAQLVVLSGGSSSIEGVSEKCGQLVHLPQYFSEELTSFMKAAQGKKDCSLRFAFDELFEKSYFGCVRDEVLLMSDDMWEKAQKDACDRERFYRKHNNGKLKGISKDCYDEAKKEYESHRRLKCFNVDVKTHNIHPPESVIVETLELLAKAE